MALPPAREIEAATLSAWPALQVAHDGLWLWRGSRGYTKRANAIHCLDPSDDGNADARLARMAAFSRQNNLPPVFRVTPLTGLGVIAALDRAGWTEFEPSRVLAMEMPAADWPVAARVRLLDHRDPVWRHAQAEMSNYDQKTIETLEALLAIMVCDSRGVLAYNADGLPAAAALASVANGIGTFVNVVARTSERGRGYGRAVVAAALNWTREAGAGQAAIQVLGANDKAISLYTSLGFSEVYRYHYRKLAA